MLLRAALVVVSVLHLGRAAKAKYHDSYSNAKNYPPKWDLNLDWSKDRLRPQVVSLVSHMQEWMLEEGEAFMVVFWFHLPDCCMVAPVTCKEYGSTEIVQQPFDLEAELIVNEQFHARLLSFRYEGVRENTLQPNFIIRYGVNMPGCGKNGTDVSLELHDYISVGVQNYLKTLKGKASKQKMGKPCIIRKLKLLLAESTTILPDVPLSVYYPLLGLRLEIANPYAFEPHYPYAKWNNTTQTYDYFVDDPLPADHASTDFGSVHDWTALDETVAWSSTLMTTNEEADAASGLAYNKRQAWCKSDASKAPDFAYCDLNPTLISWWCPFDQTTNSTPIID